MFWEVYAPHLVPVPMDQRGAGDSMPAGVTVGLARGDSLLEAVRLGSAVGSPNVNRYGLGTGWRAQIERMRHHVEIRKLST